MSKFKIRHITKYIYADMVRDSANQIMLYPIQDEYQEVVEHYIHISGNPSVDIHKDYYGNDVGTFTHAQAHKQLAIDSNLIVVTKPREMPLITKHLDEQWKDLEQLRFQLPFLDFFKLEQFNVIKEVEKITKKEGNKDFTPLEYAKHFTDYIYNNFEYQQGITTVESTVDDIWKIKTGVCQDFAHLLLVMLRLVNIPARYVSGYICPNKNGMRGEGATHAWVEAYIPDYGWLGLDPTNNCLVNDAHVRLAVGKDFSDCSPVKGTYRGTSNHKLDVTVSVSYEEGKTFSENNPVVLKENANSSNENSFRRHQQIQMQQQ